MEYNKINHAIKLMNKENLNYKTYEMVYADSDLHNINGTKEEILQVLKSGVVDTLIMIKTSSPMASCGFTQTII